MLAMLRHGREHPGRAPAITPAARGRARRFAAGSSAPAAVGTRGRRAWVYRARLAASMGVADEFAELRGHAGTVDAAAAA
jgi:hypothetical protein